MDEKPDSLEERSPVSRSREMASIGPLPRSEGERAELTLLAARLIDAADAGDLATERSLSLDLARLYASRGTDLDEALRLARRVLELGEDATLRTELSGWLSGVGEPSLAAEQMIVLAGLSETPRAKAKAFMRAAVLHARAGSAIKAREALASATAVDPTDPIAHELAGTLAAWSPDALGADSAADEYLKASQLREGAGDAEAAFEDTLRAFETSRASRAAAQALSEALKTRGRAAAADQVLCLHADALSETGRHLVHVQRFNEALAAGDLTRALTSAFDADIEIETIPGKERDLASKVDDLLARVGLYDLLAARLSARAREQVPSEAAATCGAIARLAGGPLARPERAIEAHLAAASLDPGALDSRRALRDHAEVSGDPEPYVEALLRLALFHGQMSARVEALRDLAELAEQKLSDPALAYWAFEELEKLVPPDREAMRAAKGRLEDDARRSFEEIGRQEAALARTEASAEDGRQARREALGALSRLLRSTPDRRERWIEVLAAAVRADPLSSEPARALERVMGRGWGGANGAPSRQELELYESVLRSRLEAQLPRKEKARARRDLARVIAAIAEGKPPIEDMVALLGGDESTAAALYVFAKLASANAQRAQSLIDLAEPLGPPLKAVLLSVAAEALLEANDTSTALRAAESAMSAAPSSARSARTLARVASARGDRESAAALERAMSILTPTVELCSDLAEALDTADEPGLSFAWTQRWLALTPSSPRAIRDLVRRAIGLGDASRLAEAIAWVLAQPEPFAELAAPLLDGLKALFSLDYAKAKTVARRALDVFGPKNDVLRNELVTLGDAHGDRGLSIAVIERWVATTDDPGATVFLELSLRRAEASDFDGAARELSRAAIAGGAPEATLDAARDLERALLASKKVLSHDGRIWFAEAAARSLGDRDASGEHSEAAFAAWRTLGALRWDLAEDYRGSEQALFAASDPAGRYDIYTEDLVELAGAEQAALAIRERASVMEGDPKRTAKLLTAAARSAAEHGLLELGLDTAARALSMDASQPEAVAIAEASARGTAGAKVLSSIYDGLANAAMGIYGQRAAHYRAARQLERRGELGLALKHAIASFEAVPTEGTSYQLLARLVERTGEANEAVRVLERVGQSARPEDRTTWLKRAAGLTRPTQEGLGLRLDILLRALVAQPESSTVAQIEETVLALLAGGEDPDVCSSRFDRALLATLPRLEGPDGAFVALRLARAAAHVGLGSSAFASISRALLVDAGHGAFGDLMSIVPILAEDAEAAFAFVEAAESRPTSGTKTLQAAAELSEKIGKTERAERLRATVARREAEDRAAGVESFELVDSADSHELPRSASSLPRAPSVAPEDSPVLQRESAPPISTRPDAALEAAQARAHSSGEFALVAEILEQRIAAAQTDDAKRVLRLRRAAFLEQRLDKVDEAIAELETILETAPDDPSALSFLADLFSRSTRPERAASAWERMSLQSDRPDEERVEFALKAIRAFTVGGEPQRALTRLDAIAKSLPPETVVELRVAAARASGDQLGLALALDELSSTKRFDSVEEQAAVLYEAAKAALASGDESGALLRLRRSVRLDPRHARATLEALRLEYRQRGTGTPREAQAAVDALASVTENLPDDLVELHAFLLAEELDVIQGGGAGMRELSHRHAEVGPLPLLALGMAERLARNRAHEQALPLFEKALDGDFHGLRTRGRVALAAADSAIQVGALELAQRLLDEAQRLPETRALVERRRRELVAAHDDPEIARKALEDLVGQSTGLARARFLERLAELRAVSERDAALKLYEEALGVGRHDRALTERVRRAIALLRIDDEEDHEATPPSGEVVPASEEADDPNDASAARDGGGAAVEEKSEFAEVEADEVSLSSDPPPRAKPSDERLSPADLRPSQPTVDALLAALEEMPAPAATEAPKAAAQNEPTKPVEPPVESPPPQPGSTPSPVPPAPTKSESGPDSAPPPPPSRMPASRAVAVLWPAIENDREEELVRELLGGSFDAGESLVRAYGDASPRTHDILVVRRHQAALRPGDRAALDRLLEASVADKSTVYTRAVEHVLSVGQKTPTEPPPLGAQLVEPGLLHRLLFRDLVSSVTEALSLVWETGLYRKDLGAYGLESAPRLQPGQGSPLAAAYGAVLPLFGQRALYQLRKDGPLRVSVALLSQPALVVEGEVKSGGPELHYLLASRLATTLPEFAIVASEPDDAVKNLLDAIIAAFGPVSSDDPPAPGSGSRRAAIARIGAELWQRVSPRAERRLKAIAEEGKLSIDEARTKSEAAMRRAGLFASGDLAMSLRITLEELGDDPAILGEPDGLARACAHPEVADLVRLATRMEYAEARFFGAPTSTTSPRRAGLVSRGG